MEAAAAGTGRALGRSVRAPYDAAIPDQRLEERHRQLALEGDEVDLPTDGAGDLGGERRPVAAEDAEIDVRARRRVPPRGRPEPDDEPQPRLLARRLPNRLLDRRARHGLTVPRRGKRDRPGRRRPAADEVAVEGRCTDGPGRVSYGLALGTPWSPRGVEAPWNVLGARRLPAEDTLVARCPPNPGKLDRDR